MTWPAPDIIVAAALPRIKALEGFRAAPYRDMGGKPTIGYGTTVYPTGKAVTMADPPCTEPQATIWAEATLSHLLERLQPLVTVDVTLNQATALMLLAYNVGVGVHDGIKGDLADSTLLRYLDAGMITQAADQFLVWDKARDADGVLQAVPALLARRTKERQLFLTPDSITSS